MHVEENANWIEVEKLQEKTETELNSPGIIFKELMLSGNKKYRVDISVKPGNAVAGTSRHEFQTNSPPTGGTCAVSPVEGFALNTTFTFSCTGWNDQQLPLTYQFHYKLDNGLNSVISYGHDDRVSCTLPSGKESEDGIIQVEALIIDSLSAVSTEKFPVTVCRSYHSVHSGATS